ncbi:MAG: hypothetical protein ACJARD_001165 [Alphaproteobacteria bacterium]|jgi:hypothetical protein
MNNTIIYNIFKKEFDLSGKGLSITQSELNDLGITTEEIESAGGIEALAHILWFLQNTQYDCSENLDDIINHALDKKTEQDELLQAFDDFDNNTDILEQDNDREYITNTNANKITDSFGYADNLDVTSTIRQIYQRIWGSKPHPALKLLIQAYFLDIEDVIPDALEKKEIFKIVHLLRAHVAGIELPIDAEEERIISYARTLYKEFLDSKEEFDNCPMCFLLDSHIDDLPMKYRMIAQALPVSAILKIYADHCFYDSNTGEVDEALPEEISIKNLMNMIETLARIFKIWQ